jgi:hypothetical protein
VIPCHNIDGIKVDSQLDNQRRRDARWYATLKSNKEAQGLCIGEEEGTKSGSNAPRVVKNCKFKIIRRRECIHGTKQLLDKEALYIILKKILLTDHAIPLMELKLKTDR